MGAEGAPLIRSTVIQVYSRITLGLHLGPIGLSLWQKSHYETMSNCLFAHLPHYT